MRLLRYHELNGQPPADAGPGTGDRIRDNEKRVRRYHWDGQRLVGRVIRRRKEPGSVFTWNLMPVPIELVPR